MMISPRVGGERAVSILMRVVLPAPLGPSRPKHSFSSISRLTSLTATRPLNFLVRLAVLIITMAAGRPAAFHYDNRFVFSPQRTGTVVPGQGFALDVILRNGVTKESPPP